MSKNSKNTSVISKYNAGTVAVDFVMLILGLVFLINTIAGKGDQVAAVFVRIIGGILILAGLISIITFLFKKEKELFDWFIMIFGTAIGIFGAVVAIRPEPIINIINWIMGLLIIIYACAVIITAVGILRPAGADYWGFSAIFGLIAVVLGCLIVFMNFATKVLMILIGITLIVGAVGGLANALLASSAKKSAKKVIKAEVIEPSKKETKTEENKEDEPSSGDDTTNS